MLHSRGLAHIQRLSLGHSLHYVNQYHIGQLFLRQLKRYYAAYLPGTDYRYFGSFHVYSALGWDLICLI